MKFFLLACAGLLAIGILLPVAAIAEDDASRDARWHKNIANSEIRLETRDDVQEFEIKILEHEEFKNHLSENAMAEGDISLQFAAQDDSLTKEFVAPANIPGKWNVSHFSLYQMDDDAQVRSTLPASNAARRELPFEQQNAPVAGTVVSGKVANVSVYTEFGITGGEIEEVDSVEVVDAGLSSEDIDSAINQDLAGYYVSSGANMGLGNWKIDVQAGYETAVGNVESSKQSLTASSTSVDPRDVMGSMQLSRPTIVQPQTTQNSLTTEQDPFQLVYFQGSADTTLKEKLDLKFGALCFAVPEMLVSAFEGSNQNGYGFEIFGDVNYRLGKSLNYTLYLDYALTDEYFSEDSIYQILHKVELKF